MQVIENFKFNFVQRTKIKQTARKRDLVKFS
nr:hypothetical protein pmam_474 [Pithovirus mammoth]